MGDYTGPALEKVLDEVATERFHQDEKWGEQNHPDGTTPAYEAFARQARETCDRRAADGTVAWMHILKEEFWEAMSETDPAKLREELIQVAAVAAAWIEAIDRRASA